MPRMPEANKSALVGHSIKVRKCEDVVLGSPVRIRVVLGELPL